MKCPRNDKKREGGKVSGSTFRVSGAQEVAEAPEKRTSV